MKSLIAGVLIAASLSTPALAKQAAQPAAPQAQPQQRQAVLPTRHGTPIAGLCTFDEAAAIGRSVAGQGILQQIQAFGTGLETEFQDLAQYQGQQIEQLPQAVQSRYLELINRRRQIQATQQYYMVALASRLAEGPLAQAYEERRCSMLLDAQVTIPGFIHPSADMTPTVTQKLDAIQPQAPQVQLIPMQAPQAQAPAPAPAQPAAPAATNRRGRN